MTQIKHTSETEAYTGAAAMNVEFSLPNAATSAAAAMNTALDFTARKAKLAGIDAAVEELREGNADARGYFEYALARELGEHLGALDDELQAVYLYNPEATPEDTVFAEHAPTLVHMVVWARRRTGALTALISALDRAVSDRYVQITGARSIQHLLDVQIVDDAEVKSLSGFGAMLTWLHNRPLLVWKR